MAATTTPYNYNYNPTPQQGNGAFGLVPGAIQAPNPGAALASVYPNLSGATAQASGNVLNELTGQLSPETLNNIQNQAAQFGVSSGMPLSGLSRSNQLKNLGLTTEQLQTQGLSDFGSLSTNLSKNQTLDPALQAQIAENNSIWASAPNPGAAAAYAQSLAQGPSYPTTYPNTGTRPGATNLLGPSVPGQGNPPATTTTPSPSYTGAPLVASNPNGIISTLGGNGQIPTGNALGNVGLDDELNALFNNNQDLYDSFNQDGTAPIDSILGSLGTNQFDDLGFGGEDGFFNPSWDSAWDPTAVGAGSGGGYDQGGWDDSGGF